MTVTIKDVADSLGLAVSTVSKALNGYEDVSELTKERVRQEAERLGYRPSVTARNLRSRRTNKIGFVLCSAYTNFQYVSEFYFEMLRGAAHTAEKVDYNLVLYTTVSADPERLLRICQSREVDGIILMAGGQSLEQPISVLHAQKMPFVVLHERIDQPSVSYVAPDNVNGGYLATRHLLELGHQRVAYLGRAYNDRENVDRLAGYRQALADFDVDQDEQLVRHASLDEREIDGAMASLLALHDPPTAVFAFNDGRAISALQAIHARGLRVPKDVAVVGFDDVHSALVTTPALTTVRQPLPEMGSVATETLLAAIAGKIAQPIRRVVPVELVVRSSTISEGEMI